MPPALFLEFDLVNVGAVGVLEIGHGVAMPGGGTVLWLLRIELHVMK